MLLEHVWFAEACVALVVWAVGGPVLQALDVLAVSLCVFLAAGRVGCLLVGCCHGRPSSVGIRYGRDAVRDGLPSELEGVRLFPVPALEAAGLLTVGVAGLAALPPAAAGTVFTWFLISYAVIRFGLEGLRGDERPHVLGLSVNRWMCIAEFSFAIVLWTDEHGGFGAREVVLLGTLAALLVACLLALAVTDRRRMLLGEAHVRETKELLARSLVQGTGVPNAQTTSRGVVVAATPAPDGMPLAHVSLSLGDGVHDTILLCRLAGRVCPCVVTESAVLSDASVLHVLVTDVSGGVADPGAIGRRLFGHVVRQQQADAPVETSAASLNGAATERAAYFRA